ISFFAGALIKKFGTGLVTAFSVVLTAVGMLIISFAPNVYVMMLGSVVSGLGAGAIDTGLNNYVSLNYKAIHMNWLHCFWGVGVTVSPLIMSLFLKNGDWQMGYRTISYVQFGISAIVFASLVLWRKYDKKATETSVAEAEIAEIKEKVSIKKILLTPGVITAILSLGFYCSLEFLMGTWGASFLINAKGLSADKAAQMVSLYYGGIMLGRFISGIISLKVNDRDLIRGGTAVLLFGVVMLAIPTVVTTYIGMVAVGMGCAPIFPATLHAVPDRFGKEMSTYITGYQMGGAYAIGFIVQVVFGYVATATTFQITPYVLIVFAVLTIIMVEITNEKTRRRV
ncbi:MAG: MFS transporter, partial [Clostridia bacterium]|nr:MFS transporter [Clostridia bacterium]